MRLREMQRILHGAIPLLAPRVEGQPDNVRVFANAVQVVAALQEIGEIPALASQVQELLKQEYLTPGHVGPLLAQPNKHGSMQAAHQGLAEFTKFAGTLERMISDSLPEQSPYSITLEIPDGTLEQVSERLAVLSAALQHIGGTKVSEVRVQNLDNGSLDFEVIGQIVIAAVAADPKAALAAAQSAFASATLFVFALAQKAAVWRSEDEAAIARARALGALAKDVEGNFDLAKAVRERVHTALKDADSWETGELNTLVDVVMKISGQVQEGVRAFPAVKAPTEITKMAAAPDAKLLKKAVSLLLPTDTKPEGE